MAVTEQLRRIIETCGISKYEIGKRSGVSESVLSNFMSGDRGITTDTIDKLTNVLGLKLTANPKVIQKGK